jgi:hypothetical protein
MATNDWKSVLAKLDVVGGSVNPVTAKEIAQFEAERDSSCLRVIVQQLVQAN